LFILLCVILLFDLLCNLSANKILLAVGFVINMGCVIVFVTEIIRINKMNLPNKSQEMV